MSSSVRNTFRLEKYKWQPLLSFGGGISTDNRYGVDGWHGSPYNAPGTRTIGLRYKDPNQNIAAHKVAFRSSYDTYDSQAGFTMDVKYAIKKLTSIWYRYRRVNGFLQPFSAMPDLRVMSIREHMTNFGDVDLTNNPKLSHWDSSTHYSTRSFLGGSIDRITFHPDAPLKLVYLSDCRVYSSVVDSFLKQCYKMRNVPAPDGIQQSNTFLSQRVCWSPENQWMVDELKAMGWSGFGFYGTGSTGTFVPGP